ISGFSNDLHAAVRAGTLFELSRIYSERNHEWTRINTNFRGKIEIFRSIGEGHYLVTRSDTQRLLDFHSCLFVSIRGSNCIVTAEHDPGEQRSSRHAIDL